MSDPNQSTGLRQCLTRSAAPLSGGAGVPDHGSFVGSDSGRQRPNFGHIATGAAAEIWSRSSRVQTYDLAQTGEKNDEQDKR